MMSEWCDYDVTREDDCQGGGAKADQLKNTTIWIAFPASGNVALNSNEAMMLEVEESWLSLEDRNDVMLSRPSLPF